jgi:hypothetical protein
LRCPSFGRRAEKLGQRAGVACLDRREDLFGFLVRPLSADLAIAKQAVDAPGGTIRVQNLPNEGCIFVLELPATAESEAR